MAGLVGGDGKLIAIIGDEDTVTGFVLAGVGHRTAESSNFLVVKEGTPLPQIEKAFLEFTNRDDVGIVLVNQHVAAQIRHLLGLPKAIPAVLEMPSRHAYDPARIIMQRVSAMLNTGTGGWRWGWCGNVSGLCTHRGGRSSRTRWERGILHWGTQQHRARRGAKWPRRASAEAAPGGHGRLASLTTLAAELPHFCILGVIVLVVFLGVVPFRSRE